MTEKNCTDYWLDTNDFSFVGDFEGMYRDIDDPWGCLQQVCNLNNTLFLELLFERHPYDSILDLGCGLGHFTDRLYQRNGGGRICGTDVAKTAIDKARERYAHLEFRTFNVLESPISGSYDLVVLSEVLWYLLEDLGEVFRRLYDAMSDKGCLGIKQYFPDKQRFGSDVLIGLKGLDRFVRDSGLFVAEKTITVCGEGDDGVVFLARYRKAGPR